MAAGAAGDESKPSENHDKETRLMIFKKKKKTKFRRHHYKQSTSWTSESVHPGCFGFFVQ